MCVCKIFDFRVNIWNLIDRSFWGKLPTRTAVDFTAGSGAQRSLIHFARTAASKLKSNCTQHKPYICRYVCVVCISQMRGNQNDDVKIFAHQACRLGFQGGPNGSILATGEQAAEFSFF